MYLGSNSISLSMTLYTFCMLFPFNGGFAFSADGLAFINDLQAEKLKNVIVEKGDVLLNITGDSVARACMVDKKYLPARVNQHVCIVRADLQKAVPSYLLYFLQLNISTCAAASKYTPQKKKLHPSGKYGMIHPVTSSGIEVVITGLTRNFGGICEFRPLESSC